jgi:hypothetical protein
MKDKESLRRVRELIMLQDYMENIFLCHKVPERIINKIRSNFEENLKSILWPVKECK